MKKTRHLKMTPHLISIIKDELEHIYEAVQEINRNYKKESTDMLKSLNDGEWDDRDLDGFVEELDFVKEHYPNIVNYSLFTSIFASLEFGLIRSIYFLAHDNNLNPNMKSLKKKGIRKYEEFVKSRLKSKSNQFNDKSWKTIENYEKIRDLIMHCYGNLSFCKDEKHLRLIIKKWTNYLNIDKNRLIIKLVFFQEVIKNMHDFLKLVK